MSEQQQNQLVETLHAYMSKVDSAMTEMRDRDNQRAAEIRELRQRQDALQEKNEAAQREYERKFNAEIKSLREDFNSDMKSLREEMNTKFDKIDAKFDKMDSKFDNLTKHVQTLTITSMVGIGSISVAVIFFLYSILNKS